MNCKKCGAEQSADAEFCNVCGEKLTNGNQAEDVRENELNDVVNGTGEGIEPNQEHESSDVEEPFQHLISLYVGDKIDYYRAKWKKGKNISWNWPAFFLTFFWLGYRKMYRTVFIIVGIYFALDIVSLVTGVDLDSTTNIGLVVSVVLGLSGNNLYKEHVNRQVNRIEEEQGENAESYIRENGGPSWGGVGVSVAIFLGYAVISAFLFPF
ncbi:DUF2628 domain-containing protein [Virgibacillus sp. MSJ-26]|uniref:DUF2628 domain-containing protein n=1 Tax=Virgibacillus sp. MSJ-26 TaxID=2841522 RepID=UPI001C12043B|nr:DUF2628 domain-containing protein [Virgibacillus sp. MSJ-26]MBU5467363.1 DUF2628 domain-containing protein [Virgibacillus sp. MSJ-26]